MPGRVVGDSRLEQGKYGQHYCSWEGVSQQSSMAQTDNNTMEWRRGYRTEERERTQRRGRGRET